MMERFKGSLASYRLPLVVPTFIEQPEHCGVLRVERGAMSREFNVRGGCLTQVSSNEPREHLAEVLADLRIIDRAQAAAAFEEAEAHQVPFGIHLVARGLGSVHLYSTKTVQSTKTA